MSSSSFDSSHITPHKGSNGTAKGSSASASSASTQQPNGQPVTPLKVQTKNLECDDKLFTDAFVRKFTPRSKEACRLLGVLPEELVVKPYETFHEHGVSSAIQKLRYEDYESLRQETLGMVREELMTLVSAGWSPQISPSQKLKIQNATLKAMMLPSGTGGPSSLSAQLNLSMTGSQSSRSQNASPARNGSARNRTTSPGASGGGGKGRSLVKSATTPSLRGKGNSASNSISPSASHRVLPHLMPEDLLLQQEQERLRKTMVRQNKEIESMMAYELKVAQMMAKQEAKLEARRAKEQALAEQRREERYRQAEKRRMWEMQKLEEEQKNERDECREYGQTQCTGTETCRGAGSERRREAQGSK